MSNLYGRDEVRSTAFGVVAVTVKVTFGASGAIASYSGGTGTPVVPTDAATGRVTFTFAEKYNDMLYCNGVTDYQGTPVDGQWQIYAGYDSSAGTVSLSHAVAGSETDPTSGDIAHFLFLMKKSST